MASVVNWARTDRARSNSRPDCKHLVLAPENLTEIQLEMDCHATLRDSRRTQGPRGERMAVTGCGSGIPSLAG